MTFDVVVAGAGPVGLLVASELALRGVRVLVVERLTEPDLTIKAGSINVPTAEALDRRGLLPALRAAREAMLERLGLERRMGPERPGVAGARPPRLAGHFGGIWISADDLDPSFAEDRGEAATLQMVGQADLERILFEHATGLGAVVRRGVALTGFEQDHDGVRVELGDETIECGWLVGCDGGRSLVRKLAGFDFPGTDPIITGRQAIVEMTGADELRKGWNVTDSGLYVSGPFPGRVLTVEFDGPPIDRDAPITAAELAASIRRVSGVDVTVEKVVSATRFTDNARQATSYRQGRVLLAGDAAHVHSPFGGQGLNLGVGDAMNLGWKLAAEIQGWAPAGLLDSYTRERHPIGAWVLDWTRAQIAIMKPEPYSRALRGVLGDLARTEDGATYMAASIGGLRQRYDLGSEDPRVGRSAPEVVLADGSRLADHLHGGAGVLIGAGRSADGRLEVVAPIRVAGAGEDGDGPAMLVRPDGIVAWVAGDGDLGEALRRWFGGVVAVPATV